MTVVKRDWLFEQYDNEDLFTIDSNDEGDDHDQVGTLMPSHLI